MTSPRRLAIPIFALVLATAPALGEEQSEPTGVDIPDNATEEVVTTDIDVETVNEAPGVTRIPTDTEKMATFCAQNSANRACSK